MKRYLLIVEGDTDPTLEGPFETEAARDAAAKEHRRGDPDRDDGLYMFNAHGVDDVDAFDLECDAYSGGFFAEDDEDEPESGDNS